MGGAVMGIHPCLDGYIVFSIVPGGLGLRHSTLVLKWIEEEGELIGELEGADIDEWAKNVARLVTEDPAEVGRQVLIASDNMHQFVAKRTMAECFSRAVRDGFMMAPLYTMEDIANDQHLAARNYWVDIDGHRYPGRSPSFPRPPGDGPGGAGAGTGPAFVGGVEQRAEARTAGGGVGQRRTR